MLYEISNQHLSFTADTFGAELHSLKKDHLEYLWQCREAWKRYAPILFPFICSPEDGNYQANGKTYHMNANHGFARDLEFQFLEQTENSVAFILTDSPETLAQYPYPFALTVRYTLLEDGIKIENIVRNTGDTAMYFYLGGHPAFNCPLESGTDFTDYYIQYEKNETLTRKIQNQDVILTENQNIIPVTRELFDYDAIILDHPNSKKISLKSQKSEHSVTVVFPASDAIAVWSPEKNDDARFVCLEPWTSVPVYYDDDQPEIEKKAHAIKLESGQEYCYSYEIIIK